MTPSSIYYHTQDTVLAVLAFMETVPWSKVWSAEVQADFWRYYANDAGEALVISGSPNMARIAYDAIGHAEHLAMQLGDPELFALVDSNALALKRQLRTMPDSVRLAFGPVPEPPFWIPVVLVAFIALIGSAGGVHLWRRRRRQSPNN